jgi:hypothetical protein
MALPLWLTFQQRDWRLALPAEELPCDSQETAFENLLNHPRGQIVNRSTLLKEVETDTAALLEDLRDLDDLVLQFGGNAAGDRFIRPGKKPASSPTPATAPAERKTKSPLPRHLRRRATTFNVRQIHENSYQLVLLVRGDIALRLRSGFHGVACE